MRQLSHNINTCSCTPVALRAHLWESLYSTQTLGNMFICLFCFVSAALNRLPGLTTLLAGCAANKVIRGSFGEGCVMTTAQNS